MSILIIPLFAIAQTDKLSFVVMSLIDSNTVALNPGNAISAPFAMRGIRTTISGDTMNIKFRSSILLINKFYQKKKNYIHFQNGIRYFNCKREKWYINEMGVLERYE